MAMRTKGAALGTGMVFCSLLVGIGADFEISDKLDIQFHG
jgi:hypothetical protein